MIQTGNNLEVWRLKVIYFLFLFFLIFIFLLTASRPLNNLAESQLESLLIEGGLLEIYVDQIKLLTKLVNSSRRSNLSSDVCSKQIFIFPKKFSILETKNCSITTNRKNEINNNT